MLGSRPETTRNDLDSTHNLTTGDPRRLVNTHVAVAWKEYLAPGPPNPTAEERESLES